MPARRKDMGQDQSTPECDRIDTTFPVIPYFSLFLSNLYTKATLLPDLGEFLRTSMPSAIRSAFHLDARDFVNRQPCIVSGIPGIEAEAMERLRGFIGEKTELDGDTRTLYAAQHALGEEATGQWLALLVRQTYGAFDPAVRGHEKYLLLKEDFGLDDEEIDYVAFLYCRERDGQLLLLDEADSMLQDRRLSTRSWEVSHTNELLTQMENFRGVFVACTNFLDRLGRATLRRFAWKVRLEPMDGVRRERMFGRWFPSLPLDEAACARLGQILRLSPGDFKAVAVRFEDRPELCAESILDALAEEASYRETPR